MADFDTNLHPIVFPTFAQSNSNTTAPRYCTIAILNTAIGENYCEFAICNRAIFLQGVSSLTVFFLI